MPTWYFSRYIVYARIENYDVHISRRHRTEWVGDSVLERILCNYVWWQCAFVRHIDIAAVSEQGKRSVGALDCVPNVPCHPINLTDYKMALIGGVRIGVVC